MPIWLPIEPNKALSGARRCKKARSNNNIDERRKETMKTKLSFILLASILAVSFLLCGSAFAWHYPPSKRIMDPIVGIDWLTDNAAKVVILDIRSTPLYNAGHIPDSINEPFEVPFSAWITMRDGLLLEVPEDKELFETIGSLGIEPDTWVVIVTAPNAGEPPFYGLANGTRVAATLIYAGVDNVAILDGGYPKWVAEGKDITEDVPDVDPVTFEGKVKRRMFVSLNYVRRHLGRVDIIDGRDADVYFGVTIEPFAAKAGHIPGAASLPAPWIWDSNGDEIYTFKDAETLGAMASGVLDQRRYWRPKKIVYCGVGGYASAWWFVLTQILGHQNVKFYDGSAQERVREYDMVPYQWD
jgi:thiosulfate/3-mercaptopyruvate sulfurtransferase